MSAEWYRYRDFRNDAHDESKRGGDTARAVILASLAQAEAQMEIANALHTLCSILEDGKALIKHENVG